MRKHLKDYFIPHEGNDYKPHSLQKAAMTGMVALVLLSFTFANIQSMIWVTSDWMVSTVLPAVIVQLTNDERADGALGQLRRNDKLDEAARMKAQHMAEREYFAHFSPNGVSPWYWFAQVDYNFVHAGENLAIHFTDSEEVVDAWMDSPTHRANIMNGNYTEIGIGTAEGKFEGYNTVYVVQLFGAPAALPVVVAQVEAPEPVLETVSEPLPEVAGKVTSSVISEVVSVEGETAVLAESIALTEDVVIVEAQPEPVAVAESIQEIEPPEPIDITQRLPSSFISTSTGAIPASIDPTQTQGINDSPYYFEILTQPRVIMQIMYIAIGLLILVSLVFSVVIEIRKQHPVQIAYSLALLLLMFGLFKVHELLSAGAIIV